MQVLAVTERIELSARAPRHLHENVQGSLRRSCTEEPALLEATPSSHGDQPAAMAAFRRVSQKRHANQTDIVETNCGLREPLTVRGADLT